MSSSLVLISSPVTHPAFSLVKQKTSIKYTFTTKHIDFLGQVYQRLTNDSKYLSTHLKTLRHLIFMVCL